MSRTPLSLLLLAATAFGCSYKTFDKYEDDAPIRVITRPDNFRGKGLGNVLVTAHPRLDGTDVSRIYSSAGANSPVLITRAWNGSRISEESFVRCKKKSDCNKGINVAATLIPFDVWAYGSKQEKEACVYAPATGHAYVLCENGTVDYPLSGDAYDTLAEDEKNTILFAGVGLPAGHPLGFALLGAHTISFRESAPALGRLMYQPAFNPTTASEDNVPALGLVQLIDPGTGALFSDAEDVGNFGFAVRAELVGDQLLVAIAQPSRNRVVVATFDDSVPGTDPGQKFRTRACIKTPDPALINFGKRLLLGDINGDGAPEVFVGIDPSDPTDSAANGDVQRVWMYPGTGLPAYDADALACPLWDEPPVQVGCIDGIRGVNCESTGFGAALALGDVDADGINDLIVGAPYADIQGARDAGAVWIIPGSSGHADTGGLDFDAMTNVYATTANGAHLGLQVAALRTDGRDEPVASAPGEERSYVFMCTKLEEDENPARLCLPK